MSRQGLVLEGGAFRGLFTAGIIDVMMEDGLWPDGIVGVSAGAAFGCNYKSRQPGRVIRYNMRFAKDSRYSGLRSLLTTGDYFNAEFAYHTMPRELDPFDCETYEASNMAFYAVCTDVLTGKPVYRRLDKADDETYDWIRASASMPLAAKVVSLDGKLLLDGGVTDSIPLQFFEDLGYVRNVVILTQPDGYRKNHTKLMPLMKIGLRRYPRMIEAMDRRYLMYNAQLDYVRQAELEGRCLVIRPDEKLPIGHVSHDAQAMKLVYDMGRDMGRRRLSDIKAMWNAD
jgi:predicted patatin/cPLA2 family phospholipase